MEKRQRDLRSLINDGICMVSDLIADGAVIMALSIFVVMKCHHEDGEEKTN